MVFTEGTQSLNLPLEETLKDRQSVSLGPGLTA